MLTLVAPPLARNRLGVTEQSTADVVSWQVAFAPDDDIHALLLAALDVGIAAGAECHASEYGFTLPDVADRFAVLAQHPGSRFLFDKTQGGGKVEKPILQKLFTEIPPAQRAIGTSSKAGQILHSKCIALIYPTGPSFVMEGSYNQSASAASQFNTVSLVMSRSYAALIAQHVDAMFDWVMAHEAQPA